MKKLKKWLIWGLIAALIVFGIWKWKFDKETVPPESVKVQLGSVEKTISINAVLTPEKYANIGSERLSEVTEVYVEVGDLVTKGQKLATLDQSSLWQQISVAKLAVESAVASEQESRNNASNSTKAQRLNLKNASQQARHNLNELYVLANKGVLTSPIDGVVSIMNARVGEVVTGTTSPVAGVTAGTVVRIIDPSSLHIEAFISESDIVDLSVGQKANVLFDAFPDDPLKAKIVKIDPEAVNIQDVIYFRTLFDLETQSAKVRPGMTGDVDIITAQKENVPTMPLRYINRDADGLFVWVQDGIEENGDPRYIERRITTGVEGDDGRVEITSGLGKSETIYIIRDEEDN